MAKRKKQKRQDEETLVDLVEARDNAQDFMDKYGNLVFGALVGLVVLFAGWFAYQKMIVEPNEKVAVEQMWKAEEQFARDSFQNALANVGGGNPGFVEIVKNYGSTNAGNAANLYSGISYLHAGQFDAAISYLKDFSAGTDMLSIVKNGLLGDAYGEKGDFSAALGYYKSAANSDNTALTPYYLKKLALLSQKQGDNAAAVAAFQKIKNYPGSAEFNEVDKYLGVLGN